MIDAYLKQSAELDDHAIHLLFSVNRWEKACVDIADTVHCRSLKQSVLSNAIRQDLQAGMTVVCDRYAFSGIAFTAAKVLHIRAYLYMILRTMLRQGLNYDWCKAPDIGLPAPDATFFLSVSPEVAAQRGGYGEERYESNDIQSKVRTIFQQIATEVGPARWRKINADGPKHDIEQELLVAALKVCEGVDSTIVSNLWQPV